MESNFTLLTCLVLSLFLRLEKLAFSAPTSPPSQKIAWEDEFIRKNDQLRQDKKLAKSPIERYKLIQSLSQMVLDDKLAQEQPTEIVFAAQRLFRLKAFEAIPTLTQRLNSGPGEPPYTTSYYTIYPFVGIVLSFKNEDNKGVSDQLIRMMASGSIPKSSERHLVNIIRSGVVMSDNEFKSLLKRYRMEFEQQSNRLKYLVKSLPTFDAKAPLKKLALTTTPKVTKDDATDEQIALYFESRPQLIDPKLTLEEEATVLAAVQNAGKSGMIEAAPILIDKLDFEPPVAEQEDKNIFPMYAEPQGLLSPAITEASIKAILQIGPKALPALIDAIAMRGRGSRFRANALPLIVQLAGGKTQAEKLLVQAAEDDTKKAERLREMAASLPKVR